VQSGAASLIQNRFWEKLIDTDEDQFLSCIGGLHEGHVVSPDSYEVILDFTV
jgi:hypothetical protein